MADNVSQKTEAKAKNIEIEDGELVVDDFRTSDPDVVSFFSDFEGENLESRLETALRLGVISLKSGQTAQNVDYVEKRFNELKNGFQDQVDEMLGEDGQLLDEFDPDSEGTPLQRLKNSMDNEFEKLRQELGIAKKEEEMIEKTSLKGDEFEDELHEMLSDIANVTGDKLEKTGEEIGELSQSKKGDFVITLQDSEKKIVVEAKDTYYTQPDIEEEMDEAIRNRNANYGLFIAKSIENVPNKVGWFNEYNGDFLVLCLEDGSGESNSMPEELMKIAYRWSRMRIQAKRSVNTEKIDTTAVSQEIEEAERKLESFSNIKRKCTSIEDAADDIRDEANDIQKTLEDKLRGLNQELSEAE